MARRWRGVLVVENEQSGDGRVIAAGALAWAPLPLPLSWLQKEQHGDLLEGGVQIGVIDTIERVGDEVHGSGVIDDANPDGAEVIRRLEAGTATHGERFGLSIDPDDWQVEIRATDAEEESAQGDMILVASGRGPLPVRPALRAAAGDPDTGDEGTVLLFADDSGSIIERYTRLRIRGVTACAVPAFAGAYLELDGGAEVEVVEPAEEPEQEATTASVHVSGNRVYEGHGGFAIRASTATASRPIAPPMDVFHIPEPQPGQRGMIEVYGMPVEELMVEQPDGGLGVPFTVVQRPDGVLASFGHAGLWGQCHVGYPGQCVSPPESLTAYSHFHVGYVLTAEGERLPTGVLTMGCDHAAVELRAPEARDHYAHSGLGFADVRASNGQLGVWVAGAIRPDVTDQQLYLIRASSLSGDWRRVQLPSDRAGLSSSNLEFVAALAVNVPGFPIAREAVLAAGLQHLPAAQLTASAFVEDGVQQSLVASGVVHRCPECQQRALAASADASGMAEALRLLRALDVRTRHLGPAAAAHALDRIRR